MDVIPKKCSFYWNKGKMSFLRHLSVYSFCKLNPDWEVTLIIDSRDAANITPRWSSTESQDVSYYNGKDFIDKLKNLDNLTISESKYINSVESIDRNMSIVHAKDYTFWHVLAFDGGVVADMDILFIKPMSEMFDVESMLNDASAGFVCFKSLDLGKYYMPVTFMAGSGNNNPIFIDLIKFAERSYNAKQYECMGEMCMPFKDALDACRLYPNEGIFKIATPTVFAFHSCTYGDYLRRLRDPAATIDDITIGIHWYGGSPVGKYLNSHIDEESYSGFHNTVFERSINKIMEL